MDTLLSTIFVPQVINGHTVGLMTGTWDELKSMYELAVKKGASIIGIKKFLKRSAEANNAYLASLAATTVANSLGIPDAIKALPPTTPVSVVNMLLEKLPDA